jgi:hypothetical protein
MCYKCHDRDVILSDSSFSEHSAHIRDVPPDPGTGTAANPPTTCSVCHDPHGISETQGNFINNTHLINFDVSIVEALDSTEQLMFKDEGDNRGRCYLECHGASHNAGCYPEATDLTCSVDPVP